VFFACCEIYCFFGEVALVIFPLIITISVLLFWISLRLLYYTSYISSILLSISEITILLNLIGDLGLSTSRFFIRKPAFLSYRSSYSMKILSTKIIVLSTCNPTIPKLFVFIYKR
jgi:hypothetical protein